MPDIGNHGSERRVTNMVIYIFLWCSIEQNGYTLEYDINAKA